MSLILLTDIDGYSLAINPDFIVSVSSVRNSYHGSKATVRTQDGNAHTVRDTAEEVYAKVHAAQVPQQGEA